MEKLIFFVKQTRHFCRTNGLFVQTEQICVNGLSICLDKSDFCTLKKIVCIEHQSKTIFIINSELYIMEQRKRIRYFVFIKVSDIK